MNDVQSVKSEQVSPNSASLPPAPHPSNTELTAAGVSLTNMIVLIHSLLNKDGKNTKGMARVPIS